ncbi:heme acquisition protein [Alcanivorax balearicus MACL04]|uniref:Heme acquisition protein n=1 Tax=Alloalcanivorax balearicus MACL04 TaxID=1177182 RepID=A0ABT2R4N5_9GAMM|nr:heme acquisition protein HasA [Alloalcanivorax balearicus]MCU5784742.1 heme acquisition protein [Alloalcanivorax balearicus MACL04]
MSVTVTYSTTFGDYESFGWEDDQGIYEEATVGGTFEEQNGFLPAFNDIFSIADHSANPGAFAGTEDPDPIVDLGIWDAFGTFSGTQYAASAEYAGVDLGFIVEAADGSYLNYTFFASPTHTIYGEIGSITFGVGLQQDSNGLYYFDEELVTIDGLDTIGLNGGVDGNGDVIDRTTGLNDTHNIVNGLKDGDASALWAVLDAAGYYEAYEGAALTEVLGVSETTETELELAA